MRWCSQANQSSQTDVEVALVGTGDESELVEDDIADSLLGKVLGMKLDGVEGLTATGILVTPDTVGVDGVPGTIPVCTGAWLTSTCGNAHVCERG